MATENQGKKDGDKNELEGMKHPLEQYWDFWVFTNHKSTWEENLVKLTTFGTIEDYWCLYHHMKLPEELTIGQDYAIFKKDVRPMWEDPANKSGGRWLITFDRKSKTELNTIWLYVVLLLIGKNFPNSDLICGAVVNVRPKSKIGIWIADASKKTEIMNIGKKLKEEIILPGRIAFHLHNSSKHMFTI